MSILSALLLSVIEGVTEFLPVSSTGHLILASSLFSISQSEFTRHFEIIIQLGAILAAATLLFQKIKRNTRLIVPVFYAFLPTALAGFALYKIIKNIFFEQTIAIALALIIGGIVMIVFEHWYGKKSHKENIVKMTPKHAVIIGCLQALSVFPGVSRSAATIMAGMLVGLPRQEAVEFSFLLAIPTIAAASLLDIASSNIPFLPNDVFILLIGLITAFLTAYVTMKWFLAFVKTQSLTFFGVYRIIAGVLFLFLTK